MNAPRKTSSRRTSRCFRSCTSKFRQGFTIIELLVVIAVIAVLTAILLPAVQQAREAARRSQCANNLKQLALGCRIYENFYGRFPTGSANQFLPDGNQTDPGGWLFQISPFLELQAVYDDVVQGSIDDMNNNLFNNYPGSIIGPRTAIGLAYQPKVIICPSDPRDPVAVAAGYAPYLSWMGGTPSGLTDYVAVSGLDNWSAPNTPAAGVINWNEDFTTSDGWRPGTRMADIRDGASNTLLIGERPYSTLGDLGCWTCPDNDGFAGAANTSIANMVYAWPGLIPQDTGLNTDYNGNPCPPPPYYFGNGPRDVNSPCSMNQLWSTHAGGGHFALVDGSVRFISYGINASVVQYLATYAGGEVVGNF